MVKMTSNRLAAVSDLLAEYKGYSEDRTAGVEGR